MAQALGRVVDASALDACTEPRGRLVIEVPPDWLGGEIMIVVPARLVCARCDGGGCDGCHRRGGHRIDGDANARSVRLQLPASIDGSVVVRLIDPFGNASISLAQLHLETRIGSTASADVALCVAPMPAVPVVVTARRSPDLRPVAYILFVIVTIAIVTILATTR